MNKCGGKEKILRKEYKEEEECTEKGTNKRVRGRRRNIERGDRMSEGGEKRKK